MNIEDLLRTQLSNPATLSKLGQTVGANPGQVEELSRLALPTMVAAMSRNASTPEGARSLAKAVEQHQDDKVDDLPGFLNGVDAGDGAKILQHVFGDKNERVQNNLASKTGLDSAQVMGLLVQFAPLLLGMLGNQSKAQTRKPSGGGLLGSLLGGLLGGGRSKSRSGIGVEDIGPLLTAILGGAGSMSTVPTRILDDDGN